MPGQSNAAHSTQMICNQQAELTNIHVPASKRVKLHGLNQIVTYQLGISKGKQFDYNEFCQPMFHIMALRLANVISLYPIFLVYMCNHQELRGQALFNITSISKVYIGPACKDLGWVEKKKFAYTTTDKPENSAIH